MDHFAPSAYPREIATAARAVPTIPRPDSREVPVHRIALAIAALISLLAIASSGCGQARARESFTLGEHDKIIAEAPGCESECVVTSATQRTCTVRATGCRAVCTAIPECRTDAGAPVKVCAVLRDQP